MNIKKPLVVKKNVVNMLALILTGINTNKKLSKALKRKEATISEHLAPLNKNGIIFTRENKKNNEKNYEVDGEKISEIFFEKFLKDKEFLKYKKNHFVILTFMWSISIKKGLIESKPKEFDRVVLADIFGEVWESFFYMGRELNRGNKSIALQGYRTEDKTTKKEFKNFLKLIYQDFKKRIDEEKKKEEDNKANEGKKLVENISLNNDKHPIEY